MNTLAQAVEAANTMMKIATRTDKAIPLSAVIQVFQSVLDKGEVLARHILSDPGPARDAFDADKWLFDLLVDIRRMDEEHPSTEETFDRDEAAWKRWRARKADELTAAIGGLPTEPAK